jgi:hypothetical protein
MDITVKTVNKSLQIYAIDKKYELSKNLLVRMLMLCLYSMNYIEVQRNSILSLGNIKSNRAMWKLVRFATGEIECHNISACPGCSLETDPLMCESCMISPESTDAWPISRHSVQPVKIRLFYVMTEI